jgi:hypothetical protein
VACGEIWSATDAAEIPVAEEERLRGGDRGIDTCMVVDILREVDADKVTGAIAAEFPEAEIGVYRLLCEIRPA